MKSALGRKVKTIGDESIEYYTREYIEDGKTRLLFTQYLDAVEDLSLGHKTKMQALMEVTAANPLFQVFKNKHLMLSTLASQYQEHLEREQPKDNISKMLKGLKV